MSYEEIWRELEAAGAPGVGRTARRVRPEAAHDIMLGVEWPGQARLVSFRLFGPAGKQHLATKSSRGVAFRAEVASENDAFAEIRLTDKRFQDIFTAIAEDIAGAVVTSVSSPLDSLCERLRRWQQFLEVSDPDGLSEERQAGLYAELHVLRHVLIPAHGVAGGVASWTGPSGTAQDFQSSRAAIEVKATRESEPASIAISSERQLDALGVDHLFLIQVSLDSRRGGTGQSLPQLVDELRALADGESGTRRDFDDRLLGAGYADAHRERYLDVGHSIRKQYIYAVTEGFPRLVEADLPPGVGHLTYRIATVSCGDFLCSDEAVQAVLTEGMSA